MAEGSLKPKPIQKLEEAVINRIAAGEVIVRPASALKEMLENSLDAGSSSIQVVAKEGGLKVLQITDNGHGIEKASLPILCERFTTSKLATFDDLKSIATFGFRGEALASISHVAHVTVTTMTKGSPVAYKCHFADGKMVAPKPGEKAEPRPCAGVKGTQILVEDLFYNVQTRRKAIKSHSEEYNRILEVVTRYALHNTGVAFSCKKFGDANTDIRTVASNTATDNVRTLFGGTIAKELLPIKFDCDKRGQEFQCTGLATNANYSAKKFVFILFINNRLVESSNIKRCIEGIYARCLPKGAHPWVYMSITMPPQNIDVNVHPTKREVKFLNEDEIVSAIEDGIDELLSSANNSRVFYTQPVLPGASAPNEKDVDENEKPATSKGKQPYVPQKLVRTDKANPVGQLEAYVTRKDDGKRSLEQTTSLLAARKKLRTEVNLCELSSVQELWDDVESSGHAGLTEVFRDHTFVGTVDGVYTLVQHRTKLYIANMPLLSREFMYQQVIRRFGQFATIKMNPAPSIEEVVAVALDNPASGWTEGDASKPEICRYVSALFVAKAEMLEEYFGMAISKDGKLMTLPQLVDNYIPAFSSLPLFMLRMATEVDWTGEKVCFRGIAREIAVFYGTQVGVRAHGGMVQEAGGDEPGGEGTPCGDKNETELRWVIRHLVLPAMGVNFAPPRECATNGAVVQVAALENLYKIFERC